MAAEDVPGREGPAAARGVAWTGLALADVEAIRAHIAQDDPAAASRLVIALVAAGDGLETFPRRGLVTSWFGARRIVVARRYLLYYRVVGEQVQILRIRHGARQPLI